MLMWMGLIGTCPMYAVRSDCLLYKRPSVACVVAPTNNNREYESVLPLRLLQLQASIYLAFHIVTFYATRLFVADLSLRSPGERHKVFDSPICNCQHKLDFKNQPSNCDWTTLRVQSLKTRHDPTAVQFPKVARGE